MPCEQCDDGDGGCVFPYYGVAPHTHDLSGGSNPPNFIGSTRILPREQWGDNFWEDPDCSCCGVFMRCSSCGDGEPVGTAAGGG